MFEQREVVFTLPWLHGKLKLSEEFNLYYLIGNLRQNKHHLYYKKWEKTNKDGTTRPIFVPNKELKAVQDTVNKSILSKFCSSIQSFGFMGGSCRQAVASHKGFKSMLCFDLRHAFSSISHNQVFKAVYGLGAPKLSFYCSWMIADLCTVGDISRAYASGMEWFSCGGKLPQGACTSPRLFELCFSPLDDKLQTWADRHCLVYNRYADNLFFSSQEPEFPKFARAGILSEVKKMFDVHKIRQISHGGMCRMLGLNIVSDSISNTKRFKRTLRKSLHHLEYMLDHGLEHDHAWQAAKGYMGFAIKETLPYALLEKFDALGQRVHQLNWGW